MVVAGLAFGFGQAVQLKPADGFQVKLAAPPALSVILPPGHIAGVAGFTVILKDEATVTTTVLGAAGHPVLLPFNVYVVVVAGPTFMVDVVAPVLQV